eukprot:COSAG02_NODE_144_length_34086_cov_65.390944_23_plen_244_part_00
MVAEFLVPEKVQLLCIWRSWCDCLKGVHGPWPVDLLVALYVLVSQWVGVVAWAVEDIRGDGVIVASSTGNRLDDFVRQGAFKQTAVESVEATGRQAVLRKRPRDESAARCVHFVAVPRVDLHWQNVHRGRRIDHVRNWRSEPVVAFAVFSAVPRRQVGVRGDAERGWRVLDWHCNEVWIGSHHRRYVAVRRIVRNLLHPGAFAQHGGIVMVILAQRTQTTACDVSSLRLHPRQTPSGQADTAQ